MSLSERGAEHIHNVSLQRCAAKPCQHYSNQAGNGFQRRLAVLLKMRATGRLMSDSLNTNCYTRVQINLDVRLFEV